ncbi:MAG: hypothetical protein GXY61_14295 [Lentisphaerae bacterium]|nr:hypothetical protein [Lentisphaerota bacterium]
MFPWKRREILITNSTEQFGIAQRALNSARIKYDIKIVNSGSGNRKTGNFIGRVGERVDLEIFYYVFVRKEDAEQAIYLIKNAR